MLTKEIAQSQIYIESLLIISEVPVTQRQSRQQVEDAALQQDQIICSQVNQQKLYQTFRAPAQNNRKVIHHLRGERRL